MAQTRTERVAAVVRSEMARQLKTQVQLASAVDMTQQAVSRRLRGTTAFSLDELQAVAEFLGVPLVHFIDESAEAVAS
jgi:transcriptional regulator with XRE-family HTH domain